MNDVVKTCMNCKHKRDESRCDDCSRRVGGKLNMYANWEHRDWERYDAEARKHGAQ